MGIMSGNGGGGHEYQVQLREIREKLRGYDKHLVDDVRYDVLRGPYDYTNELVFMREVLRKVKEKAFRGYTDEPLGDWGPASIPVVRENKLLLLL